MTSPTPDPTTEAGRAEPVEVLSEELALAENAALVRSTLGRWADLSTSSVDRKEAAAALSAFDRLTASPPPDPTAWEHDCEGTCDEDTPAAACPDRKPPDEPSRPDPAAGAMREALEEALNQIRAHMSRVCGCGLCVDSRAFIAATQARFGFETPYPPAALNRSGEGEE